jgi:hypothetical protein
MLRLQLLSIFPLVTLILFLQWVYIPLLLYNTIVFYVCGHSILISYCNSKPPRDC